MSRHFSQRRSCFGLSLKTDVCTLVGAFFTETISPASEIRNSQSVPASPDTVVPAAFLVVLPTPGAALYSSQNYLGAFFLTAV